MDEITDTDLPTTTHRKVSTIAKMTRDSPKGAFKGGNWNERLNTAKDAKRAVVEKNKARLSPDDPAAVERRAARLAASIAREARIAERNAARAVKAAEQASIRAREEAQRAAETAAREAEEARLAEEARVEADRLEAEQAPPPRP